MLELLVAMSGRYNCMGSTETEAVHQVLVCRGGHAVFGMLYYRDPSGRVILLP